MNGPHDLGGQHCLGPITPQHEYEEPTFHHEWERRAFALTLTCGFLKCWNIDEARHARERQHPVHYLRNTYYENWLTGLETLLVEKGLITCEELASGESLDRVKGYDVPNGEKALELIAKGGPSNMDENFPPNFTVGERVRVLNNHANRHTRVPRYTRGKIGVIDRLHGVHIFADENAIGIKRGAHIYSIRFESRELWGSGAKKGNPVFVDLWEPHLEGV
ncbi:MAG: nitrile hydratase subunit beta [Rhodospirillaceae bacterium TMED8]|nr:nitrile hydratase subunit beta [Magnetovibrio sp.]OUT51675.1 MAG: nitrile hydratase subunit beta [Rhodospirillaceae bacterium TMED8]